MNKKGFGTKEMLIMMAILLIFLLIMVYFISSLYGNFDANETESYVELENKIAYAAREYVNDKDAKNLIIGLDILIKDDYVNDFNDYQGNACSGYVIHENKEYKPYIKCQNYQTDGYSEKYD